VERLLMICQPPCDFGCFLVAIDKDDVPVNTEVTLHGSLAHQLNECVAIFKKKRCT